MCNERIDYIHKIQRLFFHSRFAVYEALAEFFLLGEQFGLNFQCLRSIFEGQSVYHVCVLQDAQLAVVILKYA